MRQSLLGLLLFASLAAPAMADQSGAVVGGLFGAAAGSALGYHHGGRDGAIAGAALGGAIGAAVGADADASRHRDVVVSRPYYREVTRYDDYPDERVVYVPARPVIRPVILEEDDHWHHHRHWDHDDWREHREWHEWREHHEHERHRDW